MSGLRAAYHGAHEEYPPPLTSLGLYLPYGVDGGILKCERHEETSLQPIAQALAKEKVRGEIGPENDDSGPHAEMQKEQEWRRHREQDDRIPLGRDDVRAARLRNDGA